MLTGLHLLVIGDARDMQENSSFVATEEKIFCLTCTTSPMLINPTPV